MEEVDEPVEVGGASLVDGEELSAADRFIGVVSEERLGSIAISLESSAVLENKVHGGSFFVVPGAQAASIGTILSVQSVEGGLRASGELLASITLGTGRVEIGVDQAPSVGSPVYIAPSGLIKRATEARGAPSTGLTVELAHLLHDETVGLSFSPERLFGRHLAVLGTSGSGKSWTAARIISECARFRSKVILLDATGEYHPLRNGVRHVYIGEDPSAPPFAIPVSIPYFDLTENDLFAIFQPRGQSQAAKLRAAIESLRIARLDPALAVDGSIHKAHRSKMEFLAAARAFASELEQPQALFDIRLLCSQIRHECVDSQQSPAEPFYWGGHNAVDYAFCAPLINRIQDIIGLPSLAPIFNPGRVVSILEEIEHFLQDPVQSVMRVNLQYLSFAHHAREIVANAIGRHLMDIARIGLFRRMPLLVVIDEAHQFLNNFLISDEESFPLDSFALMAKEGRKYSLSVALLTQRPRDIPEDILSQMGTMIVHRLINHHDLSTVERAAGDMDKVLAASVPVLRTGEAVVLGVEFAIPARVRIREPLERPDSPGPDYQRYWANSVAATQPEAPPQQHHRRGSLR